MIFKRRTPLVRVLLLFGFTALGNFTATATAAPPMNRLIEADPVTIQPLAQHSSILSVGDEIHSLSKVPTTQGLTTASVSSPASPTGATAIVAAAPPSLAQRVRDQANGVVDTALNFLGMPYRHGGTTEATGFDCSGFTRYMFEMSVGLVLPRLADQQAKAPGLAAVGRDDLQPGDLVFFNTLRRTFSHVGIYVGDGKFIHAPKPGAEVRVEDMGVAYWARRFTGARRADPDIDPMAGQSLDSTPSTFAAAAPSLVRSQPHFRKTARHVTRRRR